MSNSNSSLGDISKRINLGSTRSIFVIFTILFIVISVLFYFLLDSSQIAKSERLLEQTKLRSTFSNVKDKLNTEAQKSLKSSLLFNISNKEIDRFQTIYSLKATKSLFDELEALTVHKNENTELNTGILDLNKLLVEYDSKIASSINSDGRFTELMNKSIQDQLTSEEDSTREDFFIDEEIVDVDLADTRILENLLEQIQNQLNTLDSQVTSLTTIKIEKISKTSPIEIYIFFSLVMIVMLSLLGYFVVNKLKGSVGHLSAILDHIAKGELPEKDDGQSSEFNRIVEASNQLVHYLDDASQFAVKIGDGDFNYEFKPKSKQDALGNSLIDMRNRLQQVAREDKIRNWVNEGQAKFGEILRQHNDDIEGLGSHVITNLVEYLNASQGALFIVKDDAESPYLELLSAYAYKRKKFIQKKIEIGEGLAGQSFAEGKTIYLTEINTDHYDIQTGLGESRPSCLLIVPLKEDEKIEGIIEIASLKEFEKYQMEFVESIGESLASSLSAGKINQTTKKLLEETQEKAEQMKAQEEELRQNMEELAATQEQMERRNKEMEEVQQQLSEERYLLKALLNSSNDRIYFKDKDSKFIRVSKSMIELFDKENESEILGKSDFDFGFGEHAKVAYDDEQKIIRTGIPMEDAVETEKWDDGHITWVSTTKNPLLDLEGKIIGTFGISRDVTSSKLVEVELKKRKEWFEKFFNFHPAGFIVLDQKGKVNFATKSILSHLHKEEIGDMDFEDIFVEKLFSEFLADIDFENTKDKEVELTLSLIGTSKKKLHFLAISGSSKSEDGTQNIFLIQK